MPATVAPSLLLTAAFKAFDGGMQFARYSRSKKKKLKVDKIIEQIEANPSRFALSFLSELDDQIAPESIDGVCDFLKTGAATSYCRLVLLAVLSNEIELRSADLVSELKLLLKISFGKEHEVDQVCGVLFAVIKRSYQSAIAALRNADPVSVRELSSRATAEIHAGIFDSSLSRFSRIGTFDHSVIQRSEVFVNRYFRAINRRTSDIAPAHIEKQKRVNLESLYVEPRFSKGSRYNSQISLGDLLQSSYRTVILGDPGAGKSSCAQWLVNQMTSELPDGSATTPFLVTLRKYADQRAQKGCSILEYLASSIKETLQVDVDTDVIEMLLVSGQALVIFDGIDELLDISMRGEIVDSIDSFSHLYSTCQIVATSRIIGYEECPLRPPFQRFFLLEFSDSEVVKYVENWFSQDLELTDSDRLELGEGFISESETIRDLKTNPLMLGLLCNVYKGARTIPRTRAQLYEQCATLMFEKWDSSRGIKHGGPLKSDARAALRDVALWLYSEPSLTDGVLESDLRRRLISLWMVKLDDQDLAKLAADELLALWSGRAWVLADAGSSSKQNESIYKFTHQTFLEYFAAIEIVRKNPSPKKLWKALRGQVSVGNWEIVGQVAIQALEVSYEDAGSSIVELICRAAEGSDDPGVRINLLSFAARNIDTVSASASAVSVLSKICASEFANAVLLKCQPSPLSAGGGREQYLLEGDGFECLKLLMQYSFEQLPVVVKAVLSWCEEKICEADDEIGSAASFLALSLQDLVDSVLGVDNRIQESAYSLSPKLTDALSRNVVAYSELNVWLPILAPRFRIVSLDLVLDSIESNAFVCSVSPFDAVVKAGAVGQKSIAEIILLQEVSDDDSLVPHAYRLDEAGRDRAFGRFASVFDEGRMKVHSELMRRTSLESVVVRPRFTDWADDPDESRLVHPGDMPVETPLGTSPQSRTSRQFDIGRDGTAVLSDSSYGALVLFALFSENEAWQLRDASPDQTAEIHLGRFSFFEPIIAARFTPSARLEARAMLADVTIPGERLSVLLDWLSNNRDFVLGRVG